MSGAQQNEVSLNLGLDEAIVLDSLLARFCNDERDDAPLQFVDQAERIALWHLAALFEETLVEPFREDYDELLNAARDRLRGMYAE